MRLKKSVSFFLSVPMKVFSTVPECFANPIYRTLKVSGCQYRDIALPEAYRFFDTCKWNQREACRRWEALQQQHSNRNPPQEAYDKHDSPSNQPLFSSYDEHFSLSPESNSFSELEHLGESATKADCTPSRLRASGKMSDSQTGSSKNVLAGESHTCAAPHSSEGGVSLPQNPPPPLEEEYSHNKAVAGLCYDECTGMWSMIISVPRKIRKVFLENRGKQLRRINDTFGVNLKAPRKNGYHTESRFIVRSADRDAVLAAQAEIELMVESRKNTLPYTHFVCIPLTDPRLQARYEIFRTQLKVAYPNLDESLLASDKKLHFTLLMLRILNKEEEQRCKHVLESIAAKLYDAVDTRSLMLHLKGLFILNDDPANAAVVYTTQYAGNNVDGEVLRRLNRLCKVVVESFKDAGFLTEDEINRQRLTDLLTGTLQVKMHATIINSTYKFRRARYEHDGIKKEKTFAAAPADLTLAKADNPPPSTLARAEKQERKHPRWTTFDASKILSDFRLFDFQQCLVTSVALCKRGAVDETGFFETIASVRLP